MQTNTKERGQQALELGRSMTELKNHLRKYIQLKIKEHGINMTFEMLEVMGYLWSKDGVNQQEIADRTLRDKSSMTYLLDNLVKRKMVTRVEDGNDRRNKLIFLTREAVDLKEKLNPWVAEVYEKASGETDIKDIKNGLKLVNQMISNMKKE